MSISEQHIDRFLREDPWRLAFDQRALSHGLKIAKGRQITSTHAELLPTGDAEIIGYMTDKAGNQYETVISLWMENNSIVMESSCSCDVAISCEHAVATLEYLLKADRLPKAFGHKQAPPTTPTTPPIPASNVNQQFTLPTTPTPPKLPNESRQTEEPPSPLFLLRVERRPENDRHSWLPQIYAHAYAIYGTVQVSLEPSGNFKPIQIGSDTISRNWSSEMQACKTLYALDLQPGAETPPHSLRKLSKAPQQGTLWAVNSKEWSQPDFYWQRFRHEGTTALERRGWQVQFSPQVGLEPLIFQTEHWRAEIVEEGKGWFHLSAGFEINGESFELQPILATLVENRFLECTKGLPQGQEFLVFLPDGRGLALPVGRFRRILETLGRLMEFTFTNQPIKLQKIDAAVLANQTDFDTDAPKEIQDLSEVINNFHRIDRVPLPHGLQAELRPYQLEGFYWMQFLRNNELHGILADDMGLGKTLQCLTHILSDKETGCSRGLPSLILAPTSVVVNWQREAAKFTPGLSVLILQGPKRHAHFLNIPDHDIVLTSYALLPRDIEHFESQQFHLLALDEAQHIKNAGTQIGTSVRKLNSHHRLCLSGTPVENNLGELWSLMDFLMPNLLGPADHFNEHYRTPIEKNGHQQRAQQLADRVGPLILRRTKNNVAKELPPKTEILHTIPLNEQQKDLYETVRATMDKQVRTALAAATGNQSNIVFLDALLKLRQVCCHPSLLDESYRHIESAKFNFFKELLHTLIQENHRVLVFSQFTSMLRLLEEHLQQQSLPYLKITGETKDRHSLVERFQGGEGSVFLISLKAGGTGLTLTGADTVIHYDPWWNPAAENQATDRAYRIGQNKPVIVHKLISQGTVEEKIHQMQDKKHELATDLLTGATQQLHLNSGALQQLLSPEESI